MRHRVAGRTLGRKTNHRKAMWRNLAVSLFTHGQITTTVPKAKSVKPFVEKLIHAAKKGDLASRRRVIAALGGDRLLVRGEDDEAVDRNSYGEVRKAPRVVKHLFDDIAPRFAQRNGGYTRIVKLARHRIGDGADLCVLQLVRDEESGPQVSGQYSRRREQANKRMERAASLRKGEDAGASEAEVAVADEGPGEEPAEGEAAEEVQDEAEAEEKEEGKE